MKRSYGVAYATAILFVLVVAGFVTASFIQNRPLLLTAQEKATPTPPSAATALPTALVGFPDVEYVPIYANAAVTKAANDYAGLRLIWYDVAETPDTVKAFYDDTLSRKGWVLRKRHTQSTLFTWTDPSGNLPWQLYLDVTVDLAPDNTKSAVSLEYGRFPDVGNGMPCYPGAQKGEVTQSSGKTDFAGEEVPTRIVNTTCVSTASSHTIADFYSTALPEYGWYFYDRGVGPSDEQVGSITSEQGLTFAAQRADWDSQATVMYLLAISSAEQPDGQSLATLHLVELLAPAPDF